MSKDLIRYLKSPSPAPAAEGTACPHATNQSRSLDDVPHGAASDTDEPRGASVGVSEQHHSTPRSPRRLPSWLFGKQPAAATALSGGAAVSSPAQVVVTGVFDDDVRAEQAAAALRVWARANR